MMSDSESDPDSPVPLKKAEYARGAQHKSKFHKEWLIKYPFISYVSSNNTVFHCTVCNRTLSCAHQVEADLKRHIAGDGHTAMASAQIKERENRGI